jgi:hypothetical protein
MARRVFVSYQHLDQLKAKGFNLMRYNKGLGFEFVTRGLLDPLKSADPAYILRRIKEQMKGTSVTVVLLGDRTASSNWVAREIELSSQKDPPNGIVGIKLTADAVVPDGMGHAEILDWNSRDDVREFGAAIERAAAGGRRMSAAQGLIGSSSSCGRDAA